LRSGARFQTAQIGYGWQRLQVDVGGEEASVQNYPYIQWQVIQGGTTKLFLAVDTTCGDPDVGYFCEASALTKDYTIYLEHVLDLTGQPLKGVPPIELVIRPATATAGDAKQVHMVLDFGNSRSGVLLLELAGEISQTPQMLPFELLNRYHLDAWNEEGQYVPSNAGRWFSSKTHWCNVPYLRPQEQTKIEYHTVEQEEQKSGWFARGGKKRVAQNKVEMAVTPELFEDFSMVRMGREADDITQVIRAEGDIRTGLSSPKRYLWADDASWLEGANWHMADPHDRCQSGVYAATLQGPLLKFIHEDDRDFLLAERPPRENEFASETPLKPRHAPRSMMVAALYELLCQAYMYVNSDAYRAASGDKGRTREIRTLSLSFPSGMFQQELERLRAQAQKAIEIFAMTLGEQQRVKPELNMHIDEASAVHLTYIWSEMRLLGQDPRLWFATMRQDRGLAKPKAEPEPEPAASAPAGRRRGRGGVRRPGSRGGRPKEPEFDESNEIRIACIDIGGGTTDLMIARYNFESKIDDKIHGETLHQDGIYLGGDQLVKRLLETIIVPLFSEALAIEDEDVQVLFGPEVPRNREIRAQRVAFMNRLFVPLAQRYLDNAVDEVTDEPISHTEPEIVDPAVVELLQDTFDKLRGPGYYNAQQEIDLYYDKAEFEGVVHDTFDELLFDYCQRIVDHRCDVVLLAGQPSKLEYIQQLVRMYVPLSPSRIVPMHHHYAGNWYPYQDEKGHNPGVIVDPKSPVVVGAAIEFMARQGMLPQFRFEMKGKANENSYYWGVMTDATSGIRNERILFQPVEDQAREEITEFTTGSQRVLIGRKMTFDEEAQATPVYLLKTEVGDRIGPTEVTVKIKRKHADKESEETLEIESVTGTVAGEDAILGENVVFSWRTLADERYYLDTGGLDNIELPTA